MASQILAKITQFKETAAAVILDDVGSPARSIIVSPAQRVTIPLINRLITLSNGLPFVALPPQRVNAFMLEEMSRPRSLPPSVAKDRQGLKACVSVEAREGVSTGISAADRAATVAILGDETPNPRKLVKPGHIFPVEVKEGGVLIKPTLPEAALDLVTIVGATPAALFFDLLGPNGDLLEFTELDRFCEHQELPAFKLSELIEYRLQSESLVERVAEAKLPTHVAGDLRSIAYRSKLHDGEHLALVKGEIDPSMPVLIRVQPEHTLSDVFGGSAPSTRSQLHRSLAAIGARGSGILVYLRRPMVGELRDQVAFDASRAHHQPAAIMREYGLGAQILRDLGVKKIELLTSTSRKIAGLTTFGIEIVAQHPIPEL